MKASVWICIGWKRGSSQSVCKKMIAPKLITRAQAFSKFRKQHPELRNHTVQAA